MRLSASQMLPPRQRLRSLVTDVAWGHVAADALAGLDADLNYMVALLPTHTRVLSETKSGERFVDVFLGWENGPVVTVPLGGARDVAWTYVEHGKTRRGSATLTASAGSGLVTVTGEHPAEADQPVVLALLGARRVERMVRKLTTQAQSSEWTLISELERYILFSLETASRRVAREIEGDVEDTDIVDYYADRDNHGVIDKITIDKLAGELLYGAEGAVATSVLRRLVLRCATTAINQQPLGAYLAVNIYSQAELHVRREIGDPHVGRKVRRLARETGAADIETLIAAYRKAHPRDELGRKRAIAALTAGKTLESTATSMTNWTAGEFGESLAGEPV